MFSLELEHTDEYIMLQSLRLPSPPSNVWVPPSSPVGWEWVSGPFADLSGTLVLSNQKLAVFAGNRCTNIPDQILNRLKESSNPSEEGINIAAEQVKEFIAISQGVHIMAVKSEHLIPEILKRAEINLEY